MATEEKKESKQLEVPKRMNSLVCAIDSLAVTLDELQTRLQPVVMDVCAIDQSCDDAKEAEIGELANQIRIQVGRVESCR